MPPDSHVTMKQARNELYDKLSEEKARHAAAIRTETLYNDRRVKELEHLIAQFDARIKE